MTHKNLIGVKKKIDHSLDKAWASSQINETKISFLNWLVYHDDRADIVYRPTRGINSFIEHQNYHQS